ncbi:Imm26 family immunity protein [Variovorax sp. LT1R20]|uniref:Imm26 family immunity protein n=1 Tax=Variovorax sp. LT1R20 TaxID=3443729 RepID=UPI003F48916E
MAKRKPSVGSLVRIELENGWDMFARVLEHAEAGFYKYAVKRKEPVDVEEIYSLPMAFIVAVMNSAYRDDRWAVVGRKKLEPLLLEPRRNFIRDSISGEFSLYMTNDGSIRPSTQEECIGLEEAAVWSSEHIEERLMDYFSQQLCE